MWTYWTLSLIDTPVLHPLSSSTVSLSYLPQTSVPSPSLSGHVQRIECFCPLPRSQELNLWFLAHKAHKLGSQGPGGVQRCPHRLVTHIHIHIAPSPSSFVRCNECYSANNVRPMEIKCAFVAVLSESQTCNTQVCHAPNAMHTKADGQKKKRQVWGNERMDMKLSIERAGKAFVGREKPPVRWSVFLFVLCFSSSGSLVSRTAGLWLQLQI